MQNITRKIIDGIKKGIDNLIGDIKNAWVAILVVIIYFVIANIWLGTVCPFRLITGHYCPACGLTRGSVCVLTGKWNEVGDYNLMAFLWVPLIAWICFERYILGKQKFKWEIGVIPVGLITFAFYIWRFWIK